MTSSFDKHMSEAIQLAWQGRFNVAPNPMVGAVLVKDDIVVARGWHKEFGGPHAEVDCLADAAAKGISPEDCTLVVTLEPCNHHGKTPPCSEAIINAGIKHVVIGMQDINAEAAGGITRLKEAGITVEAGVMAQECQDLLADFIVWQTKERPYIILKMASTLDGRIALRSGGGNISSEASRERVMALRKGVGNAGGAILIGGNTFMVDNPALTARTDSVRQQPLAAIAISRLPGPDTSMNIIQERPQDCVFFSSAAQAASPNAQALRGKGARIYGLDRAPSGKGLDIHQLLQLLHEKENCRYVLCEGGASMALSLLEENIVDEFQLHLAPKVLGDEEARPLFSGRTVDNMDDALGLRLVQHEIVGGDCHLYFRPLSRNDDGNKGNI